MLKSRNPGTRYGIQLYYGNSDLFKRLPTSPFTMLKYLTRGFTEPLSPGVQNTNFQP